MKTYKLHTFITIICLAMILITMSLPGSINVAIAADLTDTNVLYDLQRDSNFYIEDFPADATDNSVQLFQIAESDTKELYVYVYQPNYENSELNPYQIAISTVLDKDNPVFETYGLTLKSSNKSLFKYKVEGLIVGDGDVRCYNISQMWRKYIASIDGESGNDNTIDAIGIEVAQLWTAETRDGKVQYFKQEIEVVTITDFYVDHMQYSEGFHLCFEACHAYYIAFNTDRQIDTLFEADVEYYYQRYTSTTIQGLTGPSTSYYYHDAEPVKDMVTVKSSEVGMNKADGWFAKKYTWDRISTSQAFLANEDIDFTDKAKEELPKYKWVVNFKEFPYLFYVDGSSHGCDATKVSDVTILRLMFETNGITYNLGTVSNRQTSDTTPGNTNVNETVLDEIPEIIREWFEELWEKIKDFFVGPWDKAKKILTIIAGVLLGIIVLVVVIKIVGLFTSRRKQKITIEMPDGTKYKQDKRKKK